MSSDGIIMTNVKTSSSSPEAAAATTTTQTGKHVSSTGPYYSDSEMPITTTTTTTTTTTLSTTAQASSSTSADSYRRGGQCCGCCCDHRRAVLIVDVMLWILTLIGFCFAIATEEQWIPIGKPKDPDFHANDDETTFNEDVWNDYVANSNIVKFGIANDVLILFVFLPISFYGAWMFRWIYPISLCVWFVVSVVISAFLTQEFCDGWIEASGDPDAGTCHPKPAGYAFQAVVVLLQLYPHLVFMKQCRNGILKPSTYHLEEKSCCCGCG